MLKDRIKPGTLVKLLIWLVPLALILANGRLTLLWVYLVISAIVLIISAISDDEKEHRNGQRKGYLGVYGNKTKGPGGINIYRRFGYVQTGLPTDELYKDLPGSRENPVTATRNRAD